MTKLTQYWKAKHQVYTIEKLKAKLKYGIKDKNIV